MIRLRSSRRLLVCLLMLTAFGSPGILAQQPTFRVGATYVRVDTYVTLNGKPVTDLTPDDFDVYEDGVRQTIQHFELVSVAPGNLQTGPRQDPKTVAEMNEKVADPRRRVFVLYFDTYHSRIGSSMSSRKAFKNFLEKLIGPEDLVAGMTPEMSPEALTFATRTNALDSFLDSFWGRRDSIIQDPEEDYLQQCFHTPTLIQQWPIVRDHRRTKLTLDSIEALVQRVGDLRDERKAIITVSEGWELFTETPHLLDNTDQNGTRPLHLGPTFVQPHGQDSRDNGVASQGMCDKILMDLSNMETVHQFRDLPDQANRANASFYIIDPRGLPASDDLLGPRDPAADQAMLRNKLQLFEELAHRTDGMALAYSNDLNVELNRIVQDLSSYYLLGYDSTNGKLDGTYRKLTVKVKRPGVVVRSRQGYRAAVLPAAGSSDSHTGATPNTPAGNDITRAVGAIMGTRANLPVRLRATAVRLLDTTTAAGPAPRASELRVVAEIDPTLAASDAWRQGGSAHFIVKQEGTDSTIAADATLKPGERVLTATIPLPATSSTGEYRVQMRVNAQSHTDALSDSTTVHVAAPGLIGAPAMLRRGPSTGLAYLATADVRFRRGDRLRLEALSRLDAAQVKVTGVDQRGQPLTLPIQVTDRQDGSATLIVADVSLAPLAPGGYAIVLASSTTDERVIVPFEVIP